MAEGDGTLLTMLAVASLVMTYMWYSRVLRAPLGVGVRDVSRTGLLVAPIFAVTAIVIALRIGASFDVRDSVSYTLLYTLMGVTWMFAVTLAMREVGISLRDDAVERRNPAAAIAIVAALVAHAAIFVGGNIGDGPGWYVVVLAAAVGASLWFALWLILELFARVSEEITVERDLAAAIRLGGLMIANGIICGRAVAGDWVSIGGLFEDLVVAWPAAVLTAIAGAVEGRLRPILRGQRTMAAVVALAFVLVAVAAVWYGPPLSHNPIYGLAP